MPAPTTLQSIGATPLIEVPPTLRPAGAARILIKYEGGNPTGSMKDRMALAMVESAERAGKIRPGDLLVEYTGGSTGSSLALACAVKGYRLRIVTADCVADQKIRSMRALGAEVEVLKTPEGKVYPGLLDQYRSRVDEIVQETGAFWTAQMENPDQLNGYAAMAREIIADAPDITDFVMAIGTGGECARVEVGATGHPRDRRRTGGESMAIRGPRRQPLH